MCKDCIYKRICKFVGAEMQKNATDTLCYRFKAIPPFQATETEERYLV